MNPLATADWAPILAHQYGWDEVLMFLVPIVLAISGVRYAERRAAERKRAAAEQAVETEDVAEASPD